MIGGTSGIGKAMADRSVQGGTKATVVGMKAGSTGSLGE
jgi:NAD(P)-dependent dehydrogenase (short-subunit alcohol dehydrogenase family)